MKLEHVATLTHKAGRIVGLTTFREKVVIATESGDIYTLERHDGEYMLIKQDIYLIRCGNGDD